MKRITYIWLAATVLAGTTVGLADAQSSGAQTSTPQSAAPQNVSVQTTNTPEPSLGTYARTVRRDKKAQATKQFDNDNLPKDDKLSVVGGASATAPTAAADNAQAAGNAPQTAQVQPGQSQEQRQAVYDMWQQRITGQQAQVDLLSRELDVAQREYRLRAAAMYGDAGDRLRNQAAWDKEDAEYKQKIAEKQKAVDDAKQVLANTQEDARRAGVPSSAREPLSAEEQQEKQ